MVELTQRFMAAAQVAFLRLRDREDGQTLVEYALIIAVVSIAVIGGLTLLTGALNGIFGAIASYLNNKVPLPS
jgi:pilus assembly protein Flp/PilA